MRTLCIAKSIVTVFTLAMSKLGRCCTVYTAYCKTWSGFVKHGFVKGGFLKGWFVKGGFVKGRFVKHGFAKGWFVKGGFVKHGFVKGGFAKHGFVKDWFVKGGFVKYGFVKGGFVKHDNLKLKRATRKARIVSFAQIKLKLTVQGTISGKNVTVLKENRMLSYNL